jgi:hypothetical protein
LNIFANNQQSAKSIKWLPIKSLRKMKPKCVKAAAAVMVVFAVFSTVSVCLADDYAVSYQLLDRLDGAVAYKLNVVIPQSLLEYYSMKSHRSVSESDFAKFVTPYALKPVADCLSELYADAEDFANGALMIVHQIPYEEIVPAKYPLETMKDNKGDCDLFAYIAASVMKAGGLNVVLLHYEEEEHMNVGVYLSEAPKDARESVYSVSLDNVTYYVAECTGGNWTVGWRVGECPDILKNATAKVITLENSEAVSPGQVSASFTELEASAVALEVSSSFVFQNDMVTFSGQLTPAKQGENVTIYVGASSSTWKVAGTAVTQLNGGFEYVWEAEAAGKYAVRASWAGDDEFRSSISVTKNAVVVPFFLVALVALAVAVAVVGAVAVFALKRAQQKALGTGESQPSTF